MFRVLQLCRAKFKIEMGIYISTFECLLLFIHMHTSSSSEENSPKFQTYPS